MINLHTNFLMSSSIGSVVKTPSSTKGKGKVVPVLFLTEHHVMEA
jgi:hypothetical protein